MQNRIIISFVIPVYNNEEYITKAVESITLQELDNPNLIEVIIVDDGSTDRTPNIVDGLCQMDTRIRCIHQSNQWIYASMNSGIDLAQGKYVYILNSDDRLENGAVSLLINKVLEYDNLDMICTKVISCNVNSEQEVILAKDINSEITVEEYFSTAKEVRANFYFLQHSDIICNQANLYRTSLLKKYHFRTDVFGADILLNFDIANDIEKVLVLPNPVYRFMKYDCDERNASIGKFYGYEHVMFNQFYFIAKNLYIKWNEYTNRCKGYLIDRRLKDLSYEIKTLSFNNCNLGVKEKLLFIFDKIADYKIRVEARSIDREREYESRILNGTNSLVKELNIEFDEDIEFIYELINNLPAFYLDDVNYATYSKKNIVKSIEARNNKDKIGKIYYSEKW